MARIDRGVTPRIRLRGAPNAAHPASATGCRLVEKTGHNF
jgi:hypothetical protein